MRDNDITVVAPWGPALAPDQPTVYQTHCLLCFRRFEAHTKERLLALVETHEHECESVSKVTRQP